MNIDARLLQHSSKAALATIGFLFLIGCVNIDIETTFAPDPALHKQVILQQSDQFSGVNTLFLSDEMKRYLDSNISRAQNEQRRLERLQELLFADEYLDIQYTNEHTQTALEIFESRTGNCLSVMNLYVAMARYIGINANFQTVQVIPTWDRRGSLLVLNQHINATGKVSQRHSYVVDFTPELVLQQLTSKVVSDSEARALYFNNLGVEHMVAEEFDSALAYLRNALWINPELSIGWNNIGTVFNRQGNLELAEFSYQMAFHIDAKNATAINNLARFYSAQGDEERAGAYRKAIVRFNRQNPYYQFAQGNFAFQSGDLVAAINHYRKAIQLKQVEPDFYTALARAYDYVGNTRLKNRMVTVASELLAQNEEIYQPSSQKIRFIDSQSILRPSSPGLSIVPN